MRIPIRFANKHKKYLDINRSNDKVKHHQVVSSLTRVKTVEYLEKQKIRGKLYHGKNYEEISYRLDSPSERKEENNVRK